ncbi:TetR/AcrR family transcriptional regulator [Actinoalloteichus sp. AHMU CJ021]|uniref:TetR/AcrR family transcriptional regulator n=1 Tax=Actinoalloteichus TaxID=65496 RepID=UPI0004AA5E4A|nr:TetR/AcrR family transcriptional regulator [Actinoalloteichus caeruleus]AUS77024.1 TetR/AcrR family transcriptional regulator [Actinoalloteichus sp. AHMU CJ021]
MSSTHGATDATGQPRRRGRPRAFDRETALRQAMEVFWERGYEGTRLTDLVQAMRMNPPSLYGAFGSKEKLFREAVEFYNSPDRSTTTLALERPGPVRDAVEALLRDNARAYVDPETPHGCLVVLSAISYSPESEGLRDLLRSLREQDRDRLRARLRAARADGGLPGSVDVDRLASFLMSVLFGLSIQARDGATLAELDGVVDITLASWDHLVDTARGG